ncbi:hypothetical protein AURDEDRAFT_164330 [Auricularia subglabra TFB-10046 SS5]|nr:hypothetical protein AURDEDRAFT_164330 [Auricularia subglabra TFB-10046 SS5]
MCTLSPFLLFLVACGCASRLINVTIDDTHGDPRTGVVPQYLPSDRWLMAGDSQAYNGTLHQTATAGLGTISISFTGIMVFAFFAFWPDAQIDVSFLLDNAADPATNFSRGPESEGGPLNWEFNQLAFASGKIPPGEHVLFVTTPGSQNAPVRFDYAVYTTEEEFLPEPPPGSPTTTIPPPTSQDPGRRGTDAVTAFIARPSTPDADPIKDLKFGERGDSITPLELPGPVRTVVQRAGKRVVTLQTHDTAQDRFALPVGAQPEDTVNVRAELERVRAENERARAEIALLRQVAEPPPYSHPGGSERGDP